MLERSLTAQTQGTNGTFVAQRPNHLPTGETRLMNGQCFKYNQSEFSFWGGYLLLIMNGQCFKYVHCTTKVSFHIEDNVYCWVNEWRDCCKALFIERVGIYEEIRVFSLGNLDFTLNAKNDRSIFAASNFPTPMEEPQKVLRAHYLGAIQVPKPTGDNICHGPVPGMYKVCTRWISFLPPLTYFPTAP